MARSLGEALILLKPRKSHYTTQLLSHYLLKAIRPSNVAQQLVFVENREEDAHHLLGPRVRAIAEYPVVSSPGVAFALLSNAPPKAPNRRANRPEMQQELPEGLDYKRLAGMSEREQERYFMEHTGQSEAARQAAAARERRRVFAGRAAGGEVAVL